MHMCAWLRVCIRVFVCACVDAGKLMRPRHRPITNKPDRIIWKFKFIFRIEMTAILCQLSTYAVFIYIYIHMETDTHKHTCICKPVYKDSFSKCFFFWNRTDRDSFSTTNIWMYIYGHTYTPHHTHTNMHSCMCKYKDFFFWESEPTANLAAHICMYSHTHTYKNAHTNTYIPIGTCVHALCNYSAHHFACTCIYCVYFRMYTCMSIYTHAYIYVYVYVCISSCMHVQTCIMQCKDICFKTCIFHMCDKTHSYVWQDSSICTGCRRLIGSLKLSVILRKRATNYKALLRKLSYTDKASYGSSPPFMTLRIYTHNVTRSTRSCVWHLFNSSVWRVPFGLLPVQSDIYMRIYVYVHMYTHQHICLYV